MFDVANLSIHKHPTPLAGTGRRVALVEDNASQAEPLSQWLAAAGFLCHRYRGGKSALLALQQARYDFLVLDWNLPGISGMDVLRQVRSTLQSSVPVLLISGSDSELDIVTALRQGADDYMTKPLRRLELLARLDALGRRGMSKPAKPRVIEMGALRMDCEGRKASRDDLPVDLTAKEFELALVFLLNLGRLISLTQLHDAAWSRDAAPSPRTLYAYISRIRTKLGLIPANGWRLAAVHHHGYRLIPARRVEEQPVEVPDTRIARGKTR